MIEKLVAFLREGVHVRLDIGGHLIHRDKQRELARAERVEDLAVVVTDPDGRTVGDQPKSGKVGTLFTQRTQGDTNSL